MPTVLKIDIDSEGTWEDLSGQTIRKGEIERIGALPGGMAGGRTSISICVRLEDGSYAFAETSLRLLQQAAAAFTAAYGLE